MANDQEESNNPSQSNASEETSSQSQRSIRLLLQDLDDAMARHPERERRLAQLGEHLKQQERGLRKVFGEQSIWVAQARKYARKASENQRKADNLALLHNMSNAEIENAPQSGTMGILDAQLRSLGIDQIESRPQSLQQAEDDLYGKPDVPSPPSEDQLSYLRQQVDERAKILISLNRQLQATSASVNQVRLNRGNVVELQNLEQTLVNRVNSIRVRLENLGSQGSLDAPLPAAHQALYDQVRLLSRQATYCLFKLDEMEGIEEGIEAESQSPQSHSSKREREIDWALGYESDEQGVKRTRGNDNTARPVRSSGVAAATTANRQADLLDAQIFLTIGDHVRNRVRDQHDVPDNLRPEVEIAVRTNLYNGLRATIREHAEPALRQHGISITPNAGQQALREIRNMVRMIATPLLQAASQHGSLDQMITSAHQQALVVRQARANTPQSSRGH